MLFGLKKPVIALAPMADYTDRPFGLLCREIAGKNFVIFRQMVSAEAIVRDSAKTLKMCEFDEVERPLVIQIFGAKPATMAEAVKIISEKFQPDGIDINMGCPVPKIVSKNKAGAALMKEPELAEEIVRAVRAVLPTRILLSVKTRLGWSRPDEILSFAPRLEAAGADFLTIHGRTKTQGYTGKADWAAIGRVKKILKIPVIANGDILTTADSAECLRQSGADGAMLGRGALGNPWILKQMFLFCHSEGVQRPKNLLSQTRKILHPFGVQDDNLNDLIKIVLRHAELHIAEYGDKAITTFRKHLLWYFKGNRVDVPEIKKFRVELALVDSLTGLKKILGRLV